MKQPKYGDIFAGHDDCEIMAQQARILWAVYQKDLEERNLWNSSRAETLDRLVRYKVEHDYYHPIVVSEGPTRIGPNGGECVNMKWSMVQKLADRIDKLEKALTLTPESVGAKVPLPKSADKPLAAKQYLERSEKAH